jgi:hypothetical protein
MYRKINAPSNLFFSVHSIPRITSEGLEKSDAKTIWHTCPNYTFLNMPFTHSTMYKICDDFIKALKLKNLDNLLRLIYLHCAPTFRDYMTLLTYPGDTLAPNTIHLEGDTLSRHGLKYSSTAIEKDGRAHQLVEVPKYVKLSIVHNYNPDIDYYSSSANVDPLGSSTYVTPS